MRLLLLTVLFLSSSLARGEDILFKKADPASLNKKQADAVERIKKEPTTVKVFVTALNKDALDKAFFLAEEPELRFKLDGCKVEKKGIVITVIWNKESTHESVVITMRGTSAVGVIDTSKETVKSYEIKPLDHGIHAIVQVKLNEKGK